MSERNSPAVLGGPPLFVTPLSPGQRFLPDWASYEAMFRDIFVRQYYTNQGPLTQRLEERLADYVDVRHAICMTNEFVGLISVTHALGLCGRVIVPALSSHAMRGALQWTAVQAVYCDVDAASGLVTVPLVEEALGWSGASAVLALNPWGDACTVAEFESLAVRRSVTLYVDSSHGFGCAVGGRRLGSFGKAEIISFNWDNLLGTLEGCVVCTNDDDVAAFLRNMRSSYGMGRPFAVPRTTNGRMSEAQAALGLFALDHLDQRLERNRGQFQAFQAGLEAVPGLSVRVSHGVSPTNYQNVICLVDESEFGLGRDELIRALRSENIVATTAFSTPLPTSDDPSSMTAPYPFPNAAYYAAQLIELPVGASVDDSDIVRIVERLALIQSSAESIKRLFAERA